MNLALVIPSELEENPNEKTGSGCMRFNFILMKVFFEA